MVQQHMDLLMHFEGRLYERFEQSFSKWHVGATKLYKDPNSIPMLKIMGEVLSQDATELVRYYFVRKIHSCWLLLQSVFISIASNNIGSTQVSIFPILRTEIEQLAKINWIIGDTLSVTNDEGISKFSARKVGEPGAIQEIFKRTAKIELCEILSGLKEEELFLDDPDIESRLPSKIDAKLTSSIKTVKELFEDLDLDIHSESYIELYDYIKTKKVFGFGVPDRTSLVSNFIKKYYSMSNVAVKARKPYANFSFLSHSPDYAILQYSKIKTIGGQKALAVSLHPSILDNLMMAQTFLINVVCWNYLVYGLNDDYFCKEVIKLNKLRNEFIDALQIDI